jgi:VDE lipocalin domain
VTCKTFANDNFCILDIFLLFSFFISTEFWENWYVIGENDPNEPEEFKFIYYNGKTRQNTYSGAFIYSRTKELSPTSLKKVYDIALNAGMNPDQFCRIRNGCFVDNDIEPQQALFASSESKQSMQVNTKASSFRGLLKSTRISELLGVEPVEARDTIQRDVPTAKVLTPDLLNTEMLSFSADVATGAIGSSALLDQQQRSWWHEVGDYFENPHRHFQVMDELRVPVQWPK